MFFVKKQLKNVISCSLKTEAVCETKLPSESHATIFPFNCS